MAKQSLATKLTQRLTELDCWVHKSNIETRVKSWGHLADTGDRTLRHLEEEGIIEKRKAGKSLEYKIAHKKEKKIPIYSRVGDTIIINEVVV